MDVLWRRNVTFTYVETKAVHIIPMRACPYRVITNTFLFIVFYSNPTPLFFSMCYRSDEKSTPRYFALLPGDRMDTFFDPVYCGNWVGGTRAFFYFLHTRCLDPKFVLESQYILGAFFREYLFLLCTYKCIPRIIFCFYKL